tara:strand:- start:2421 stop:3095 length:675 start_codon:yes stop_codon:yes gene_type:complete
MNSLMKEESNKKLYEDCSDIIDQAISKQRYKWRLNAVKWFDFDDVEQIIKSHIAKKWHMWDQTRPLEPWIGRIISNQIRNLLRNHYGNYTNPCELVNTPDHDSSKCPVCIKWSKTKKIGLALKVPLSTEDFVREFNNRTYTDFNFKDSLKRLDSNMRQKLTGVHYRAYRMLYFEQKTEEDVAKFMGYKISPEKKKLGYRQVKNLKKKFLQLAMDILRNKDIIDQ